MKFSESIRLGSMATNQAFELATDPDKACALQAALLANGKDKTVDIVMQCEQLWPWAIAIVDVPPCGCKIDMLSEGRRSYAGFVIHLNDVHRWERQRIASWMEHVEPKLLGSSEHSSVEVTHEVLDQPAHTHHD